MKTKLAFILLLFCHALNAQQLADSRHFKIGFGSSYLEGSVAQSPYDDISLRPGFNLSLSFEGYGKARKSRNGTFCLGGAVGYEFISAPINQNQLLQYFGEGSSLQFNRQQVLLQGPFGHFIVGLNQPFHPFVGLGFHTAFLRPSTFTVENQPTKNFYSRLDYQANGLGRINPTASLMAGVRYITPWKLSISLKAEAFFRQVWTQQYQIEATPINQKDQTENFSERIHRRGTWATFEMSVAYTIFK